jgi:dihydrodipicolinate synthase/N-acetylneuraminate lyase
MTDDEVLTILGHTLDAVRGTPMRVLVGVLKTTVAEMHACLDRVLKFVGGTQPNIIGYTICAPKGDTLTQAEIEAGLSSILERGLPTALYQLPQVTQNELTPETVQRLVRRFTNVILFKDTSGADRVANAKLDLGRVVLVRGAEGDYLRQLKLAGGVYDGFLLSTANGLASSIAAIRSHAEAGRWDVAQELNARVVQVVQRTFARVATMTGGNPFANANKLIDHIMAYGAAATRVEPPLTFEGIRLPADAIADVAEELRRVALFPASGYFDSTSADPS